MCILQSRISELEEEGFGNAGLDGLQGTTDFGKRLTYDWTFPVTMVSSQPSGRAASKYDAVSLLPVTAPFQSLNCHNYSVMLRRPAKQESFSTAGSQDIIFAGDPRLCPAQRDGKKLVDESSYHMRLVSDSRSEPVHHSPQPGFCFPPSLLPQAAGHQPYYIDELTKRP